MSYFDTNSKNDTKPMKDVAATMAASASASGSTFNSRAHFQFVHPTSDSKILNTSNLSCENFVEFETFVNSNGEPGEMTRDTFSSSGRNSKTHKFSLKELYDAADNNIRGIADASPKYPCLQVGL